MSRPPTRAIVAQLASLAGLGAVTLSAAQPIIPNPLIQPAAQTSAAAASASAATPAAAPLPRGQGRQQPAARPGEPQDPAEASPEPQRSGIPSAVLERVSSLYVAAIVDRAAVLRSQMAVPQVVFTSGAGASGFAAGGPPVITGGGSSTSSPSVQGGGAGATQGVGAAAGGSTGPGAVYRAPSYVVRDGQVVDFIDVHQVVARVTRDTVVLYLLAESNAEDRRPRVVFRGSIDSVIASPPAPSRSLLESPDGGLDGRARRDLTNVDNRGSLANGRSGGVTPSSAGSNAGSAGGVR